MKPITYSIITPVYDTPPRLLRETVDSVLRQTYPHWQLCMVEDHSPRADLAAVMDELAQSDPRIQVAHRSENGGISRASNDALAMATGDYVALLDDDDLLDPHALGAVNHYAYRYRPDALYTDDDKLFRDGTFGNAFIKPGWSPDYLDCCMYLGHLCVYRRDLVQEVGGFRPEFDGSQDWDLALRIRERTDRFQHVPGVYYHWRVREGSAAAAPNAKPYAIAAGRRAVADAMRRRGIEGWVQDTQAVGHYLIRRKLDPPPAVSVIMPTAGASRLVDGVPYAFATTAVEGLVRHTDYENFEIVCLLSEDTPVEIPAKLREIAEDRIRFLHPAGPFDYARTINIGAAHADGEVLLLLNDDVEPLDPDWLRIMVELAQDPGIGVVGAKLLYEDRSTIQHAGVIHVRCHPAHRFSGEADGVGYFGNTLLNMNYLAVTGACQAVRKPVFEELGGYSLGYPMNFNDVDFCLKAITRGYRVVQANAARLIHFESRTRKRTVDASEIHRFLCDWNWRTGVDEFATIQDPQ